MSEASEIEKVLCVESSVVREMTDGHTWLPGAGRLRLMLTAFEPFFWVARGERLEKDETVKQLIPYVVLRSGDRIYRYTRGMAGGEDRLHHRHSIGIGGHINPCDGTDPDIALVIGRAAYREFKEEVGTRGDRAVRSNQFVGMINDDSDAVGRCHLGVAFVYDLYSTDIEPKETALADGRWVTPAELWATPNLERWSGIVVQNLFPEGGVL